jgi:hypothetical protein
MMLDSQMILHGGFILEQSIAKLASHTAGFAVLIPRWDIHERRDNIAH